MGKASTLMRSEKHRRTCAACWRRFYGVLCGTIFLCGLSYAYGPAQVATGSSNLWTRDTHTPAGFDEASRAEIAVFVGQLDAFGKKTPAEIATELKLKSIDSSSLERIRWHFLRISLENMQHAQWTCRANGILCKAIENENDLLNGSLSFSKTIPSDLTLWYEQAQVFHRNYAAELLRLAALWPKITSEIDIVSNDEKQGFELHDKQFRLSFDDGPTARNGETDKLIDVLNRLHLSGTFYILGERLQQRSRASSPQVLQTLYAGHCTASHGWTHKSHAVWNEWQSSVVRTQQLLQKNLPTTYLPLFRPPYGQRKSDSGSFFRQHNISVALWNMDSQDWNAKMTADSAAQRIYTLMLLWRRGVILFHDIHPKAREALPWLVEKAQGSGIIWANCSDSE